MKNKCDYVFGIMHAHALKDELLFEDSLAWRDPGKFQKP
jgi:hypothetical protein